MDPITKALRAGAHCLASLNHLQGSPEGTTLAVKNPEGGTEILDTHGAFHFLQQELFAARDLLVDQGFTAEMVEHATVMTWLGYDPIKAANAVSNPLFLEWLVQDDQLLATETLVLHSQKKISDDPMDVFKDMIQ